MIKLVAPALAVLAAPGPAGGDGDGTGPSGEPVAVPVVGIPADVVELRYGDRAELSSKWLVVRESFAPDVPRWAGGRVVAKGWLV